MRALRVTAATTSKMAAAAAAAAWQRSLTREKQAGDLGRGGRIEGPAPTSPPREVITWVQQPSELDDLHKAEPDDGRLRVRGDLQSVGDYRRYVEYVLRNGTGRVTRGRGVGVAVCVERVRGAYSRHPAAGEGVTSTVSAAPRNASTIRLAGSVPVCCKSTRPTNYARKKE